MDTALARSLHRVVDPLHAWVYLTPESKPFYADAGLKGQWMGYFASRSAAMGPVQPAVVEATFFGFAPALVRRAIPDAWALSTPERVIEARLRLVDQGLRRLLGDLVDAPEVKEAAALARAAADAADCAGRPLAAAHRELADTGEPHVDLWQAITVLREHRGDGHLAALLGAGLDGRESLLTMAAIKPSYRDFVHNLRGWTAEELAESSERLRERGLVDAEGNGTPACQELRARIEDDTDRLALQPYRTIGQERSERLRDALAPLAERIRKG